MTIRLDSERMKASHVGLKTYAYFLAKLVPTEILKIVIERKLCAKVKVEGTKV